MAYRLGVDIGGTFTDFLLVDEETGAAHLLKTPSTPTDSSIAVVSGWLELAGRADIEPGAVRAIMHGTTVGTNALLQQHGGRVGLITTQGFREILHLARGQTPPPYGMWITMVKPDPLADLEDTREIDARIDAGGTILHELDEAQARGQIASLVDAGIESLTVSLLNAYVNPEHEHRIRAITAEIAPGLPVSLSSDISSEFREYERTLTTVVNAYLKPQMESYLASLGTRLADGGLDAPVNVIRSDGGLMSLAAATERPVHTILSGPAGGVAGAIHTARHAGYENVLTFDMGGTSTDVSIVRDGQPAVARDLTLGYYTIRTPALMIHTVGAGGGSIAHVPELTRALRVGPQSAGAAPGPAAYGAGGIDATVTDANVVLGHLPPALLAGAFELDRERAYEAVERVGKAIGLDVERAAQGILDIVDENMYSALRVVSIHRGHDPRRFALFAYGGAGPLHANSLARLMGAWPVIVPVSPGVLCAQGHVASEFRHEITRTHICRFDRIEIGSLIEQLETLGQEAEGWLASEGVPASDRRVEYEIGVRYYRQGLETFLPTSPDDLRAGLEPLAERYGEVHQQLYGFLLDAPCETVSMRAIAVGSSAPLKVVASATVAPDASEAIIDWRRVYFDGSWRDTPHYDRGRLRPGHRFEGPAVVMQLDSTVLVLPEHEAEVDRFGNILIWPGAGRRAEGAT